MYLKSRICVSMESKIYSKWPLKKKTKNWFSRPIIPKSKRAFCNTFDLN